VIKTVISIVVVMAGVFALGGWQASSASAAKPEPQLVSLDCRSDGVIDIAVSGANGIFSAAHVVGGGTIIPVAFSNQHSMFTDNQGHVFTDNPPDVSHNAPHNKDILSCHFTATFTDANGSGTFSGDVDAFIVATH
jgi:hypothetical protein